MTTMYDYHQVADNCSHFRKVENPEQNGMFDEIDIGESCTVCEHFDGRRRHCRLDLYDKIHSGLTSYYYK